MSLLSRPRHANFELSSTVSQPVVALELVLSFDVSPPGTPMMRSEGCIRGDSDGRMILLLSSAAIEE